MHTARLLGLARLAFSSCAWVWSYGQHLDLSALAANKNELGFDRHAVTWHLISLNRVHLFPLVKAKQFSEKAHFSPRQLLSALAAMSAV